MTIAIWVLVSCFANQPCTVGPGYTTAMACQRDINAYTPNPDLAERLRCEMVLIQKEDK